MVEAASSGQSTWTVTQYAGSKNYQSMFYTIRDQKGRLAVIDGGWEDNADSVLRVIEENGGTVDAWIITHPHPDHVGALNGILRRGLTNRIRIKKIITVSVDEAYYKKTAKAHDSFSTYTDFKNLSKNIKTVYVRENDTLDLLGLKMKVLNAWSKDLRKYTSSICNCGSMMFRLDGKKTSMLFCADVMKKVEASIIKKHGADLAATYVQCSHHGNHGLSKTFYDYVKAKGAFIDAPSFMTEDKTGTYTTPELIQYFKDKGTKLYLWNKTRNSVTIR
ncbi:MAG: MBL fold metallo-hydrolase [Lachnospiraceae bacterium]|nr:MBL fold metallo-hydrolase [Lachnospiraceae bacterium]